MTTTQTVIITVLFTAFGIGLGWFVIWLFTSMVENRHLETRDAAVRDVFKNWQWQDQQRHVNDLTQQFWELKNKVDPPKKRVAK